MMKKDLNNSHELAKTEDEMKNRIIDWWSAKQLDPNFCKSLFESMPTRKENVISNDGYPLKY